MAFENPMAEISPAMLARFHIAEEDRAPMVEALERLSDALAAEGLTPLGRDRVAKYVNTQLGRLDALTQDRARYPEIAEVQVSTPIVIAGAPRSGTTFIHSLLSQDPQHRSPLTWEVEFPSPPPQGAHLEDDPRIERWIALQSGPDATYTKDLRNPEIQKKHLIGALLPEECGGMISAMLRSPTGIWALARATPYNDWVYETQMGLAYRLHRRWLQHLQWRSARNYWLLKYPMHAYALPQLTAEYPHALVIQTHREPEEIVSSLASLIGTLREGAFETDDDDALGREMLEVQAQGLDRSLAYRRQPGARAVVDVGYRELLDDPMAVVARIYDQLGVPLTAEAETRMTTFLRKNPQGKAGHHSHGLAAYGLTVDAVRERTKAYREAFEHLL
ncbi:sulfotransferase [Phenylobacterium sp.]|uniref:sulfotransferase family protein n=1 Tax=Phenylobacterium sp. TaxID=1871053 RepID=UPI00301D9C19